MLNQSLCKVLRISAECNLTSCRSAATVPNASSSDMPSISFFSKLPIELRTIIWRMTLEPRIVELEYCASGFFELYSDPPALLVCQDSRNAVIDQYPLCFGTTTQPARTRFNFALDTLYIDYYNIEERITLLFAIFKDHEISGLQRFAIDGDCARELWGDDNINQKKIFQIAALVATKDRRVSTRVLNRDEDRYRGVKAKVVFFVKAPEELDLPPWEVPIYSASVVEQAYRRWFDDKIRPAFNWRRVETVLESRSAF